jgi:CelD/BcsL family acetyltransferase involved in cellulose biosynthesis
MLSCSILRIGGEPAAFTFSVTSGTTRYFIANSYSAGFAAGSPGRILLYRDFAEAAAAGIETIGWGAGDPGYKTEMGAEPGPEVLDCLFVRGRLLGRLMKPFWERR